MNRRRFLQWFGVAPVAAVVAPAAVSSVVVGMDSGRPVALVEAHRRCFAYGSPRGAKLSPRRSFDLAQLG